MLECLGYEKYFLHGYLKYINLSTNIFKKVKEVLENITDLKLKGILTELLVENKPIDEVFF